MTAVQVVCFGAGGERFAVAAAEVARLGRADADADHATAPHLAELLALAPTVVAAATRVVILAAGGATRALTVDAPLEVRTVTSAGVVVPPPGLAIAPVVGFAYIDQRLTQLLDVSSLLTAGPVPAEDADVDPVA
ncbi:MAG: hypothetical protein R3B06_20255 [Kofleriaceae bacterium]